MSKRLWLKLGAGGLLLLGLAYVATSVEAYTSVAYVCEDTGSMYGYHLWPGGFVTHAWTKTSPLEAFVAPRMKRPLHHRWSRCAYMGTTIFGDHISFADGPVGGVASVGQIDMQRWINRHTEKEVLALYEDFRTASVTESVKRADRLRHELHPDG